MVNEEEGHTTLRRYAGGPDVARVALLQSVEIAHTELSLMERVEDDKLLMYAFSKLLSYIQTYLPF